MIGMRFGFEASELWKEYKIVIHGRLDCFEEGVGKVSRMGKVISFSDDTIILGIESVWIEKPL